MHSRDFVSPCLFYFDCHDSLFQILVLTDFDSYFCADPRLAPAPSDPRLAPPPSDPRLAPAPSDPRLAPPPSDARLAPPPSDARNYRAGPILDSRSATFTPGVMAVLLPCVLLVVVEFGPGRNSTFTSHRHKAKHSQTEIFHKFVSNIAVPPNQLKSKILPNLPVVKTPAEAAGSLGFPPIFASAHQAFALMCSFFSPYVK